MVITDVQVRIQRLPYKDKNWKIASGPIQEAKMVFVDIYTDEGITGHGCTSSGAPFISGETEDSIMSIITNLFSKLLVGKDPFNIEEIMETMDRAAHMNLRAKAGIDLALHDLMAKAFGVPLCKILGGKKNGQVPIMRIISLKEPEAMAKDVKTLAEEGYKAFKIKIGTDKDTDIERIRFIRSVVPNKEIILTVDMNGFYTPKEAIKVINALEPYEISLVEQPVARNDIDGLVFVKNMISIPIEVDESVISLADAARIARLGAADCISVKLLKMGGIHKVKKIAALCEAFGLKCVVGATPGSVMIDVASAHFFVSTSNVWFAGEVGESVRMNDDPIVADVFQDGCLNLPDKPGLGISFKD